jgi:hypothetical protein
MMGATLGFFLGLTAGLAVVIIVSIRVDWERIKLNKAIYAGDAVPDENGNIGWVIK